MAHIFEYAQKYEQCPTDNLPCVHPFFWYLLQPGFYIPSQQGPLPEEVLQARQRPFFFGAAGRFQVPLACHILSKWEIDFEGGPRGMGKKMRKSVDFQTSHIYFIILPAEMSEAMTKFCHAGEYWKYK